VLDALAKRLADAAQSGLDTAGQDARRVGNLRARAAGGVEGIGQLAPACGQSLQAMLKSLVFHWEDGRDRSNSTSSLEPTNPWSKRAHFHQKIVEKCAGFPNLAAAQLLSQSPSITLSRPIHRVFPITNGATIPQETRLDNKSVVLGNRQPTGNA
jgi:hypothetical protein